MPSIYGYYSPQAQLSPASTYLLNSYGAPSGTSGNYTDYSGYANPQQDTSYGVIATPNPGYQYNTAPYQYTDPSQLRGDIAAVTNNPNSGYTTNGQVAAPSLRNWQTSHPVGVLAAMIAAAAGGAALAGGAATGAGAGAGAGAGSGVGMAAGGGALASDAALGAAADAGVGAFGAGAGAAAAGAGAAGVGAAGGLGMAAGGGSLASDAALGAAANGGVGALGAGTAGAAGGGSSLASQFQNSVFGDNAQQLAASGGIQGGAGVGGTSQALGGFGTGVGAGGGKVASYMDWIAPLISAGSSIYGSNQASKSVSNATDAANAENRRQFDLVRADTAGQRALGDAAIGTLGRLNGYTTGTPDLSVFHESPDYQFNLSQGQQAIDRSLAAKGGALSGAGVKAGIRYASGMADKEYAGFVDRLFQQAGIGSTGIAASANAGANATGNISSNLVNSGNTRASIYMDNAANVNNAAQTGYSTYVLRRYLGG